MSPNRLDIAASLWLAAGRRSQWTKELASVVAWVKCSTGGLELAWDPGAGENWVLMSDHRGPVAMVHVDVPLVICVAGLSGDWPYPLVVVDLEGAWQEPCLEFSERSSPAIADFDGLAEMLRHEAGPFSAQDFWFYTV